MKNTELASLSQRIKKGDEDAFVELYNQMWNPLYYTACKHLGSSDEAMDIVQDTFMDAKENIHKLKEDLAFSAWLNRILFNKCADMIKRNQKFTYVPIEDMEQNLLEDRKDFLPEEILYDKELCQEVSRMVAELPAEQRATILLYYYNQLSTKEIAETLNISPNAVKIKMSRARTAIKSKVEKLRLQGASLYSVIGLPVLTRILMADAQNICKPEVKDLMWLKIQSGLTAATAIAGTATAATAGTSTGAGTATTATGASSAASASSASTLIGQVALGVLAVAVVGGGIWTGVYFNNQRANNQAAVITSRAAPQTQAEAVAVESSESATSSTMTESIEDLSGMVGKQDADLIRSWSNVSTISHNEDLLKIIGSQGFKVESIYASIHSDQGMYVLYSLDKENSRALICEFYQVDEKRWGVAYSVDNIADPIPDSADLKEWFSSHL